MGRKCCQSLREWFLEVEMGLVWGIAGLSIIMFVFAAIWFIDPALLTLVLQFRQAKCLTQESAILVGISNCSWTSCRLGCTREVFKCWQVQVRFEFTPGSVPYRPPWASLSVFERGSLYQNEYQALPAPESTSLLAGESASSSSSATSSLSFDKQLARLYPNVRGCGYPPELDCDKFYKVYSAKDKEFDCWVSTLDTSIAMTQLDLDRAKEEVIYSLIPLFLFIVSILYAFCRLGVFTLCNPLRACPKAHERNVSMDNLTPEKLFDYKKELISKKSQALASFQKQHAQTKGDIPTIPGGLSIPSAIQERREEEELELERDCQNADKYHMPEASNVEVEHDDESIPEELEASGRSQNSRISHLTSNRASSGIDPEAKSLSVGRSYSAVSIITVQPHRSSDIIPKGENIVASLNTPLEDEEQELTDMQEFELSDSSAILLRMKMGGGDIQGPIYRTSPSPPQTAIARLATDRRRPASGTGSLWSIDERFHGSAKKKKS
eukprot:TCALIF_13825-PA protein Name:"Similar to tipE Protein tipE (Drosophila melanogaster)" AED:0.35 eAED:0.35 QI:0/-1/0/1/-1/1/1/0/495